MDICFRAKTAPSAIAPSITHIIQQAGESALLPIPVHPYMLRRTGLYYRAALLLQPLGLTLRQCCLLWNWHSHSISRFSYSAFEYRAIDPEQVSAFLAVLSQIKAFSGIQLFENVIDYVLGAYLLFPQLKNIPHDYWLAPLDLQINFAEKTPKNKTRLL